MKYYVTRKRWRDGSWSEVTDVIEADTWREQGGLLRVVRKIPDGEITVKAYAPGEWQSIERTGEAIDVHL